MKKTILTVFLCFGIFISGCTINPLTGQEEFMLLSPREDIEIGKKYSKEIEKELGRIDDDQLQNYIQRVGTKVARFGQSPYFEYTFTAVDDDQINAFALPGGYIFITKGLLKKINSENQLAGVLAHEVVHVVARDTAALMSREIGMSVLMAAASSTDAPAGVLRAAQVTHQILGLSYSRKDERTADLGGLDYMVKAGYNPYGMVETMQIFENEQEVRPIEFFSTHPSPVNRIGYIAAKIQAGRYNPDSLRVGKEDYRKNVTDIIADLEKKGELGKNLEAQKEK
jgi:predicted Zn-dependent protease